MKISFWLYGFPASLAGPDPNQFLDWQNKNLAVSNLSRACGFHDLVYYLVYLICPVVSTFLCEIIPCQFLKEWHGFSALLL